MFSTAYKLVSGLLGAEGATASPAEEATPKYPCTEVLYGTSIDEVQASAKQPADLHQQTKQISGTITHVFGDYGLINEDIYFKFSAVLDRACPVVGASVQAVVNSTQGDNGLATKQASSVAIVTDWFDSNDELKEEMEDVVVGKITAWDKRSGVINDHIPFTRDALPYDFKPYRGDWVKVVTVQDLTTGQTTAKSIKPLRERHFAGELTHWYPGYGFIDGNIYFHFLSCDGFRPQKGDWLTGVAIESDQNRGKWRGMKVFKRSRPKPESSGTSVEDIDQQPQVKWKEELYRNKCGVVISEITDVLNVHLDDKIQLTLNIKNTFGSEHTLSELKVSCCSGLTSFRMFSKTDPSSVLHPPIPVHHGSEIGLEISMCPRYLGKTSVVVTFQFEDFQIGREIVVKVLDASVGTITNALDPPAAAADSRKDRTQRWGDQFNRQQEGKIMSLPGVRPHRSFDYNVPVKLPGYPVSKELQSCIMDKRDVRDVRPVLTEPLMMETYSRKFSALLHLEEIQMDIDIRMFDMEGVSMKPWREFLALEVPGLAEGRPSVLVGDKIILSTPGGNRNIEYDGFVHEVHGEHVLLKFNPAFHESYHAERYNVRFTFSRTPLRRCHQACEFAINLGTRVLFPSSSKSRPPQVDVLLNTQNICFNRKIDKHIIKVIQSPSSMTSQIKSFVLPIKPGEDRFIVPKVSMADLQEKNFKKSGKRLVRYFNKKLNARQRAAVVRILQGESRPIPYILFGPPGTGKTITVVEAILQVHHSLSHSRVLACTPSNSAADLLAERLHASGQVTTSDMVRLNAFRRQEESIPEEILPYCKNGDDLPVVARHRIIVATCSTAGSLYQLGLKAGHFTHVFLDEAGQATEPEAMVIVSLSVGPDGQSILAGDPRQLGPVLRSNLAKEYGLEQSLLERLMDREAYQRDEKKFRDHGCYNPLLVTKLVDNYRSHPALLKLPSRLFYHGELEPKADKRERETLCDWSQLPNQDNTPLIFHGIKGEDLKEGNSPSWFNPVEAVQAVKYLQALLAEDRYKLTTDDVGIITPYRKQVEKINLLLNSLCIQGVKVGSVEEFQGQERMAIIISTVRSDESLMGFDRVHQLGFVSSPKRFNVAITRPKALLIVVGNPHILASDANWRALLQYCSENGAYVGCELPDLSQYETTEEKDECTVREAQQLRESSGTESQDENGANGASSDDIRLRENPPLSGDQALRESRLLSEQRGLERTTHDQVSATQLTPEKSGPSLKENPSGPGRGSRQDGCMLGHVQDNHQVTEVEIGPMENQPLSKGNSPQVNQNRPPIMASAIRSDGNDCPGVGESIHAAGPGVEELSKEMVVREEKLHECLESKLTMANGDMNIQRVEGVKGCEATPTKTISPGRVTSNLEFMLSQTSPEDVSLSNASPSLVNGFGDDSYNAGITGVALLDVGQDEIEGDIVEYSNDLYDSLELGFEDDKGEGSLYAQLTASPVVNTYSPTFSSCQITETMQQSPGTPNGHSLQLGDDGIESFNQDFRMRGGQSTRSESVSSTSSSAASSEVEYDRERRRRHRRITPPTQNPGQPQTPKTKLACKFQQSPGKSPDQRQGKFIRGMGRGLIYFPEDPATG